MAGEQVPNIEVKRPDTLQLPNVEDVRRDLEASQDLLPNVWTDVRRLPKEHFIEHKLRQVRLEIARNAEQTPLILPNVTPTKHNVNLQEPKPTHPLHILNKRMGDREARQKYQIALTA